jgi:hypothetical protein
MALRVAAVRALAVSAALSAVAVPSAVAQHADAPVIGHATAGPSRAEVVPARPAAPPEKPKAVPAGSRRGAPSSKSAALAVQRIVAALGARQRQPGPHEHSSPLHNLRPGESPTRPAPLRRSSASTAPPAGVAIRPRPAGVVLEAAPAAMVPRSPVAWPARAVAMQWPAPPPRVELRWPRDQFTSVTLRWDAARVLAALPSAPASVTR